MPAAKPTSSTSVKPASAKSRVPVLIKHPDVEIPPPTYEVVTLAEFFETYLVGDTLNTRPPYQRQGDVWNLRMMKNLIAGCLNRGGHLTQVQLVQQNKVRKWDVLDGLQRITCLRNFVKGGFPIPLVTKGEETRHVYYADLQTRQFRHLMKNWNGTLVEVAKYPYIPTADAAKFFVTKNGSGVTLSYEEQTYGPAYFARVLLKALFGNTIQYLCDMLPRASIEGPRAAGRDQAEGGYRYRDIRIIHDLLVLTAGYNPLVSDDGFLPRGVGHQNLKESAAAMHQSLMDKGVTHDDYIADSLKPDILARLGLEGIQSRLRRASDLVKAILNHDAEQKARTDHRNVVDLIAYFSNITETGHTSHDKVLVNVAEWSKVLQKLKDTRKKLELKHSTSTPSMMKKKFLLLDAFATPLLYRKIARPAEWEKEYNSLLGGCDELIKPSKKS